MSIRANHRPKVKKYLASRYDGPSKPTKYHLYKDCGTVAGLDMAEADASMLAYYGIAQSDCCKVCAKRQGKDN